MVRRILGACIAIPLIALASAALAGMALILGPLLAGWLITLLVYAATRAARAIVRSVKASSMFSILGQFLGVGGRWRVLVPVVVMAPVSFVVSYSGVAHHGGGYFLQNESTLIQTAAQVIAALLVTTALTPQVSGNDLQVRAMKPVLAVAVIAAAVGEVAAVAALISTPSSAKPSAPVTYALPTSLQPVAFSLVISGGLTALLAVVLAGRRLLRDRGPITV